MRGFVRRVVLFVLIGLVLYGGLYVATEQMVARHAQRNRFFSVKMAAPDTHYDHVILGASHAAVFDYREMNARLAAMTGSQILNLAVEGGGVTVNRFLLDYFLTEHRTSSVIYILDSFVFYSREWNEDRLQDAGLFMRAPWDPQLAAQLLRHPATRILAADYISGFSKINNPDRFAPDVFENEGGRFDRTYRPVPQIDRQRIAYLYPDDVDQSDVLGSPYFDEFETLIEDMQARDISVTVVRPPIPSRIYDMIPGERQFDATLASMLAGHDVAFHDLSAVNNDEPLFFDSDHLNQEGVLSFFEDHLAGVLLSATEGREGLLRNRGSGSISRGTHLGFAPRAANSQSASFERTVHDR